MWYTDERISMQFIQMTGLPSSRQFHKSNLFISLLNQVEKNLIYISKIFLCFTSTSLSTHSLLWSNKCLNPVFHAQTKHVELDYFFLFEKKLQLALWLSKVSSKHHIVDICSTKHWPSRFFERFDSNLVFMVVQVYGGVIGLLHVLDDKDGKAHHLLNSNLESWNSKLRFISFMLSSLLYLLHKTYPLHCIRLRRT